MYSDENIRVLYRLHPIINNRKFRKKKKRIKAATAHDDYKVLKIKL